MYKLTQEFTFSWSWDEETKLHFTGEMEFIGTDLNENGALISKDFQPFIDVLETIILVPELLTLEIVSKLVYDKGKGLYPKLNSIRLWQTQFPEQKAEYSGDVIDVFNHVHNYLGAPNLN
jgi:hypothetical protein